MDCIGLEKMWYYEDSEPESSIVFLKNMPIIYHKITDQSKQFYFFFKSLA